MDQKYVNLLNNLRPYVICHEKLRTKVEESSNVFNQEVLWVNPLKLESAGFVNKIIKLDGLSFSGAGMGMPKWVLFDCAMLPSFVFGFAIKSGLLGQEDRGLLELSEKELFPISMYIAIPQAHSDGWFGHNLSSLNQRLQFDLSGLGLLTKAYALELFKISKLWGATQWDSPALNLHLKFSQMKIHSAHTINHTKENSVCYSSDTREPLESLKTKKVEILTDWTKIKKDQFDYRELQTKIEYGEHISLIHADKEFFYFN